MQKMDHKLIKVFLVEDETIIRNGIKESIAWEQEGLTFAGEAADGEIAYSMIKEVRPDILISDIRMPFMDGIELASLVKKEMPDVRILFLTGYGEFEYAKKAINIGVEDYLLKPISSEELLRALKKVCARIEEEQKEKMNTNLFFSNLLEGNLSVTEALEKAKELNLDLTAQIYGILRICIRKKKDSTIEETKDAKELLAEKIEESDRIICFEHGADGDTVLLKAADEEEVAKIILSIGERMEHMIVNYPNQEYFCGVGTCVHRLSEISNSYYEATRAFANRFLTSWNRIVRCEEALIVDNTELDLGSLGSMDANKDFINRYLRNGLLESTESFVDSYFANLNTDNMKSLILRQYMVMDVYLCCISFGDTLGIENEVMESELGTVNEISAHLQSVEAAKQHIVQLIRKMILLRDQMSGGKYEVDIQKAQIYIQENYQNPKIYLNDVASLLGISPSYFSSIFKQETGRNFTEYLAEVRIDKAKELLMCSNRKISEIGFEVGYNDSHYFNYIFKKLMRCSPKEYRQRGKE